MTESLDDIRLAEPSFWKRPDRLEVFARFRRERPVARQSLPGGGRPYWSLSRHRECRAVTRQSALFLSGYGTGLAADTPETAYDIGGMLNRDAPFHPRLRRIVARVFTPRLLQGLEPAMAAAARRAIGAVAGRGACDFAADMASRMPLKVICDMLGAPESDRDELARLTQQALGYGDEAIGDMDDAMEAFHALNAYGEALARERRRRPGDDLVSAMAAAETDGEGLSDRDVGVYFQLLITAGIETTGSSIAQGMRFLAENPDQWRAWRDDYDGLVDTALEEIVRYASPVVHFGRTAARDLEIAGQPIAAGDRVVFWYVSANRDETVSTIRTVSISAARRTTMWAMAAAARTTASACIWRGGKWIISSACCSQPFPIWRSIWTPCGPSTASSSTECAACPAATRPRSWMRDRWRFRERERSRIFHAPGAIR